MKLILGNKQEEQTDKIGQDSAETPAAKADLTDTKKAVSVLAEKQLISAENHSVTDKSLIDQTLQTEKSAAITQPEILEVRKEFLYEVIEKREQNGKHYAVNDGTVTAIFQNQAIHYLDPSDNKFKDIDNSLQDTGGALEAKATDFEVKVKKDPADPKALELTKKDCKVSIGYSEDAVKAGLKLEIQSNVKNKAILKNIKDYTDIQYIIESDRVKENIVINKQSKNYEYDFYMDIENLTAVMPEDGKALQLKSKTTGEVVFFIPAPFMVDANGAYSDLVWYEIENQKENTLNLKIFADAQWLNAKDREFPVVITPQIVSSDTSLFSCHNLSEKISASEKNETVLTVRKSLLNFTSQKISKVILKLPLISENNLKDHLSLDITGSFIQSPSDFNIAVKPDFINSGLREEILGVVLEVEYLTSDDSVPAKENFSFAGGVNGTLNLNTGEIVTGFTGTNAKSSALDCRITHVHKKNSTNYGCGKNWRLNLHQTLVKNTVENAGVDYIYTDSDGEKHGFSETYYYLDSSDKKVVVQKSDVTVELDGTLWYKSGGNSYEVFKDQRTATGLTLTAKMEGFKNIENLEQRQKEQKQLEEYVESCKNNLKEQVIMETAEGSEGLIYLELKNYFGSNGVLSNETLKAIISIGSTNGKMILNKGEAMQYRSLYLQKKQLEDQFNAMTKTQRNLLKLNKTSLEQALNSADTQIIALMCQRASLFIQRSELSSDTNQFSNLTSQISLIGDMSDITPDNTVILGKNVNTQIKCLKDQKENIKKQIGADTNGQEDSDISIGKQIDNLDKDALTVYLQTFVADNQMRYISEKAAYNIQELKRIFKEYANKEFELKKLKEQTPVSYLSDGSSFLCFNEEGNLCSIVDSYDNYILIERDSNGRISKVYDGERATVLKYNFYGQLVSVTDPYGRKSAYTYSAASKSGNLIKITNSAGDTLEFAYAGEEISSIDSSADKTKTSLSYTSGKLSAITNRSAADKITDGGVSAADIVLSETGISYTTNECAVTSDGNLNWYIMDRLGNLIGGYSKLLDDTYEERLSFSYFDRTNNWCYSVKETGDPAPLSGKLNVYTGKEERKFASVKELRAFLSAANLEDSVSVKDLQISAVPKAFQKDLQVFTLSKDLQTAVTVQPESLPAGKTEFMFSAYAATENASDMDMRFGTAFRPLPSGGSGQRFEIVAEVNYKNNPSQTFTASFDCKNKGKQFCALPVTLDKDLLTDLQNIILKYVYTGKGTAAFTEFRFAPCEWEYKTFDQFKNINYSENSTALLNNTQSSNAYEKTVVNYICDNDHRLAEKRAGTTISIGSDGTVQYAVSKYYYNDRGSVARIENYIEGEEGTTGTIINETVYDDKGNAVKNLVYNSLDSTSKGYSENEYYENGQLKAEIDVTGENVTTFEYGQDTDAVKTVIAPDGGKFSYGRDYFTGAVTGITQSGDDGEANSVETKYTCGVVTRLKSGLNTVNYEYDYKRRKTKVLLNGIERVNYSYEESILFDKISVNGLEFKAALSDRIITTLKGGVSNDIVTEAITDKRGNLLYTSIDGELQSANSYNAQNLLISSVDNITGRAFTAVYDDINMRVTASERTAGTKEYEYLAGVSEKYDYNDRGELNKRTVSVNGIAMQTYLYAYKNDAARDLDYMAMPNGLSYKPQKDAMGRRAGSLLEDPDGNPKFGEYISYRKTGDHTTDMISSIRYGQVKNGRYVIGGGLNYKYDVCGNISEIWENGEVTVVYSYDKLQRLVREDNKMKGKTWFYSYDNNGNILSKKETGYTRKPVDEIMEYNYKKFYSYGGDKLTDFGGESFSYDGFCDPVTYRNKPLVWEKGRLIDFNGLTFKYDGSGQRLKKCDTVYTYDLGGKLLRQSCGDDILEFIYDGSGLSGVKHGDIQYVYRWNMQGDITHIFDIAGTLIARYAYDAWGNHTVSDPEGNPITDSTHIGNLNPFRYRGYLYDTETGLYFLQTRYYDPETGRFISQDKVTYLDPDTVNGLNLYAYCGNNPVMRVDHLGTFWKKLWNGIKAAGRFILGVVLTVVGSVLTAVGVGLSFLATFPGMTGVLDPLSGTLTQTGLTMTVFGVCLVASVDWTGEFYADLSAIDWNPFNTNAEKAAEAHVISFYKGMPVIKGSYINDRSWSYGIIFLDNTDGANILRHESGHGIQLMLMGPANYGLMIGIPSSAQLGSSTWKYYNAPWEITADLLGGVKGRPHSGSDKSRGWLYFAVSNVFGPLGTLFWFGW